MYGLLVRWRMALLEPRCLLLIFPRRASRSRASTAPTLPLYCLTLLYASDAR